MMKRLLALAMLVGLLGVSEASVPAVTPQAPSPYARPVRVNEVAVEGGVIRAHEPVPA